MKQALFILLILTAKVTCATDSIPAKRIILKTWLFYNEENSTTGYLNKITDSTVMITDAPFLYGSPTRFQTKEYSYIDIYKLQYKRKNSLSRGFLFGFIGGAAAGAIIGLATYKKTECPPGAWICIDFGPGPSALGGALVGSLGGGLIGMAVGASSKKTFLINSRKENFNELKESIQERVYPKY